MKVSDEIRAKGRDALCDMEIATGKIDDSARALIADAVIDAVKDDIVRAAALTELAELDGELIDDEPP